MKSIILYGTGETGKKLYQYYAKQKDIEILNFCDSDISKKGNYLNDIEIISPNDLQNIKFNEIVIASMFDDEIYKKLVELGVNENKISRPISNLPEFTFGDGDKLKLAIELMLFVVDILNKNSINYHIDHGTLLGIIRDGRILPWDVDIDMAILSSESYKTIQILENNLENFNSKLCNQNRWKLNIKYEENLSKTLNSQKELIAITIFNDSDEDISRYLFLDVYPKYLINNDIFWSINQRRLICDKDVVFPTKEIIFQNQVVLVPHDCIKYLENLYGDWKTPVKEWSLNKFNNIRNN